METCKCRSRNAKIKARYFLDTQHTHMQSCLGAEFTHTFPEHPVCKGLSAVPKHPARQSERTIFYSNSESVSSNHTREPQELVA